MRIISLLPSATEIVCALGLEDQLVGVSHDCDWPPAVTSTRPVVSGTRVDVNAASADIDRQVRELSHGPRSIYHLDAEQLARLEPDLILTQELCDVCAPAFDSVRNAARLLERMPRIVSLEPNDLEGILENIRLIGELTGTTARAEAMVTDCRRRIQQVRDSAPTHERPKVLCLEWLAPPYLAGHWVPQMVQLAGGEPLGEPGARSVRLDWHDIEAFAPEVIVLMPCGFDTARTRAEADVLAAHSAWHRLPAVRCGRVYPVHGSHYFSRPGPRTIDGLEQLAHLIHPHRFADPLEREAVDADRRAAGRNPL